MKVLHPKNCWKYSKTSRSIFEVQNYFIQVKLTDLSTLKWIVRLGITAKSHLCVLRLGYLNLTYFHEIISKKGKFLKVQKGKCSKIIALENMAGYSSKVSKSSKFSSIYHTQLTATTSLFEVIHLTFAKCILVQYNWAAARPQFSSHFRLFAIIFQTPLR